MRIPITMCHGISWQPRPKKERAHLKRLTAERFEMYFRIASEMGFQSISYNDLARWCAGELDLPGRPIMFDFDHPDWSIGRVVEPIMSQFGYKGNLFVNTSPMEKVNNPYYMKWDDIGHLIEKGWHIGSHTHNHYDLDYLAKKDPSGDMICEQLEKCDEMIYAHLGIRPRDFAYTSTTWSQIAENEVRKRYRFARLWIIGAHYKTDKGIIRYAELVGADGDDEIDGGPPFSTRYITQKTDPFKLPSMELEYLIFGFDSYRRYIENATEGLLPSD
ncbi:MAG: polysaccharide deacetylase family protein [Candidatus Cloacimonadota bacterium]|nr:MAG: polysaccharide deacetylase family protein [Candidatus Cloacimonadota bacterium]